MSDKLTTWVFNRRVVEDQEIYVKAETREEAWARVRAETCDDTSDPSVVKTTYRYLREEQP